MLINTPFMCHSLIVAVFIALLLSFPMKGFPESVVAAALSRIGMKVLHLDRSVNT